MHIYCSYYGVSIVKDQVGRKSFPFCKVVTVLIDTILLIVDASRSFSFYTIKSSSIPADVLCAILR